MGASEGNMSNRPCLIQGLNGWGTHHGAAPSTSCTEESWLISETSPPAPPTQSQSPVFLQNRAIPMASRAKRKQLAQQMTATQRLQIWLTLQPQSPPPPTSNSVPQTAIPPAQTGSPSEQVEGPRCSQQERQQPTYLKDFVCKYTRS